MSDTVKIVRDQLWIDKKKPARVVKVIDANNDDGVDYETPMGKIEHLDTDDFLAKFKLSPLDTPRRLDVSMTAREAEALVDFADQIATAFGHERLTVHKCELTCPCSDLMKVKALSWDDFQKQVQSFVRRHSKCLTTNVLPFGEDKIDVKQKPENGEARP